MEFWAIVIKFAGDWKMRLNKILRLSAPILALINFVIVPPTYSDSRFPFKDIGDGKPALTATLTLVDGIAIDSQGNIFLSHRSKNRIRKIDKNGIITTVAGNGYVGFSGDGGPALEASFNFPAGLAFDPKGNLYVADRNNHRVRKIDPSGTITTVAGNGIPDWGGDNGPAINANLNYPSDVVCDEQGNLFISDRSNNRIRKVDAHGIITTYVGLGPAEFGGDFGPAEDALLKYPFGITLDKNGNLFIADRGNNRIRKVDGKGIITTVAGDGSHFFSGDFGPAFQSSLAFPTGVAVDEAGNLYIADRNNNRVRKVDSLGIIRTIIGTGAGDYNGDNEVASETSLKLPFAVETDAAGNLLIVDRSNFRVRKVNQKTYQVKTIAGNGEFLFKGDGGPARGASLETPSGIVIDSQDNIIFADLTHNRIRKINAEGIINTLAGNGYLGNEGDGGPAVNATLYRPSAMALDAEDNIYLVSSSGSSWIVRKIDAQGTISLFAGNGRRGYTGDGGLAVEASFYTIRDIATDRHGNLFVVDISNENIRKIDKNGIITTIAKENWKNLEGEIHPNAIVIDSQDNIFVSDSGSSKIRKIDPDGNITTIAGTGDFKDYGTGGPALQAGIRSPGGLAFSPAGELYVAEEQSHLIRKIDKNGNWIHVAGMGKIGYAGDGGPAAKATIKNPYRMAFDKKGNLYFTDRDNNRIRKVDSEGIITTVAGNQNIGWQQDGLQVQITVHVFP